MARRKQSKGFGKTIGGCLGCGCLVFFLALLAVACQVEHINDLDPAVEQIATFDDPIEIPLDDAREDAEPSLARNFYFIFDGSGSMKSKPSGACRGDQRSASKLEGAQQAVEEFLAKVPDDVNLGLYLFDTDGRRETVPLGAGNRQAFLNSIYGIQAGGGTPLAPGISFGTDQLVAQYKQQLGYGEYRLVVVTDGRAEKIPEAARYAAYFGMPIYAIGLCIDEDHPLRQYAVSYRAADSFEDLAKGLEETLAELPDFDATEFDAIQHDAGDLEASETEP